MQANPIKITSTNSLSFNSAEMFTASHVSDGINLMLLLFLLCLLISFNLTRESEKKVVRVRFSPLFFLLNIQTTPIGYITALCMRISCLNMFPLKILIPLHRFFLEDLFSVFLFIGALFLLGGFLRSHLHRIKKSSSSRKIVVTTFFFFLLLRSLLIFREEFS